MKKHVILTAALNGALFTKTLDEKGQPKLDKNGEQYGYIRVENPSTIDLQFSYKNGGVVRGQSALHTMSVAAWKKAEAFYKLGMEIPGNVRIIETLTPEANRGFKPKFNTSEAEGGIPLTRGGKQIFRKTEFDPTGLLEDVLVEHDNVVTGSNAIVTKDSKSAVN